MPNRNKQRQCAASIVNTTPHTLYKRTCTTHTTTRARRQINIEQKLFSSHADLVSKWNKGKIDIFKAAPF